MLRRLPTHPRIRPLEPTENRQKRFLARGEVSVDFLSALGLQSGVTCPPTTHLDISKCSTGSQRIHELDPLNRQKIDRNGFWHEVRFLSIFCRFSAPYLVSVCTPKTSSEHLKMIPQVSHHIPKFDTSDRQKIDRNEFQHRVRFLSIFCRLSAPYLVSACRPRRPRTPQNDSKVPTTSLNYIPWTDSRCRPVPVPPLQCGAE